MCDNRNMQIIGVLIKNFFKKVEWRIWIINNYLRNTEVVFCLLSLISRCQFDVMCRFFLLIPDLNDFEHTVFVHVIDQCPQDSKFVVAIIADVLSRLKTHDPSIEQACIRSDNAGCYHSASTILSIPAISEKCGIAIRRWDFADPQGGRGKLSCSIVFWIDRSFIDLGSSDRFAAVLKSHVRRYLNEKHDVGNAEQFVEACLSHGGVKNVDVVECQFSPGHQSAKFQLNNIKKFRNFCFERHGVRAFRAWDIGDGLVLPYNKLIDGVRNWIAFSFLPKTYMMYLFRFSWHPMHPRENNGLQNFKSLQETSRFQETLKSFKRFQRTS